MRTISLIAVIFLIAFTTSALAIGPGKTLEWKNGAAGKVIFDGKVHADKGQKCADCHPKIFKMKFGNAKMKMADLNAGKFCGECHNGKKAFKTSDSATCNKCHKK